MYENVSEVIIDPETGEADEVVVYITDPALMPRLATPLEQLKRVESV